jgi:hypothetical protein
MHEPPDSHEPQDSHDLPQPVPRSELHPPELATLASDEPTLAELFRFMEEAELRFESLRMRIVDRRMGTSGEEIETSDIWLRHPGMAKVVTSRDASSRDFDIWVGDGDHVRTYDARIDLATFRRRPAAPLGSTDERLPSFARLHVPVTPLPSETLADTFIHPHGFTRNVLSTGRTRQRGTSLLVDGREAILLRCDHPKVSHELTDRPDHWLEVGVDRQTGLILLLAEHIGGRMTRHGEVAELRLDVPIGDEAFRIHVSPDTKTLY